MRVHHLNCGTMDLPGAGLICHVLLVETNNGLVLVDSGFGLLDIAHPKERLGAFRRVIKPRLDPEETAALQVERLGFSRGDVRHIVLTHFDLDHIGGIADFPHAQIHVTAAEARGAVHQPSRRERIRYRSAQWSHGPKLVEHEPDGETWRGFAAAKPLSMIDDGIVLISLPGHTRGHAAVAVDAGDRWVLHGGDCFYHPGTLDGVSKVPFILNAQEKLVAWDRSLLRANQARLAELYRRHAADVSIVCAHDPGLLQGCVDRSRAVL